MKKLTLLLSFFAIFGTYLHAQHTFCNKPAQRHALNSASLSEEREYWISLPLNYSDTVSYPVIYVLDAEWRFDMVRHMAFDLGANNKIQQSIIVGIPHINWEFQRGIDLTFSQTRIEYDGEAVDSTWYNASNSGGAEKFYQYLVSELIPDVNKNYSTNDHETLIGHSYGGYFGGYLLALEHPFEVLHMYDPSIWYSNGEVIQKFRKLPAGTKKAVKIHITYQPEPAFHKEKIEELISEMERDEKILLTKEFYPEETHNSLFLDSFYKGILSTHQIP